MKIISFKVSLSHHLDYFEYISSFYMYGGLREIIIFRGVLDQQELLECCRGKNNFLINFKGLLTRQLNNNTQENKYVMLNMKR